MNEQPVSPDESQIKKLLNIMDMKLNRAPDRWMYRAAAVATVVYTTYVIVSAVVIPFFNYVALLPVLGCMGWYVYIWRNDRYRFGVWYTRCLILLNVLTSMELATFDLLQTDVNLKVIGFFTSFSPLAGLSFGAYHVTKTTDMPKKLGACNRSHLGSNWMSTK